MNTNSKKAASSSTSSKAASNTSRDNKPTNSADDGHCPNCRGKEKPTPEPKKTYELSNEQGGTQGHRGEQLYFPALSHSEAAPYSDEAYQDDDTD